MASRVALTATLQQKNDSFKRFTDHNPHVHSAIVDSGASGCCANDFSLILPGTLRKLDKPIPLEGIAGGYQVEYIGKISLETVDSDGNILPVEQTVMVNEKLPCILLSPQALLHESAKSFDDHFSVFADRTEWHVDGTHRVDIPYD